MRRRGRRRKKKPHTHACSRCQKRRKKRDVAEVTHRPAKVAVGSVTSSVDPPISQWRIEICTTCHSRAERSRSGRGSSGGKPALRDAHDAPPLHVGVATAIAAPSPQPLLLASTRARPFPRLHTCAREVVRRVCTHTHTHLYLCDSDVGECAGALERTM